MTYFSFRVIVWCTFLRFSGILLYHENLRFEMRYLVYSFVWLFLFRWSLLFFTSDTSSVRKNVQQFPFMWWWLHSLHPPFHLSCVRQGDLHVLNASLFFNLHHTFTYVTKEVVLIEQFISLSFKIIWFVTRLTDTTKCKMVFKKLPSIWPLF